MILLEYEESIPKDRTFEIPIMKQKYFSRLYFSDGASALMKYSYMNFAPMLFLNSLFPKMNLEVFTSFFASDIWS